MTTIGYIQNVGFDENGSALMVAFTYNSVNKTGGTQRNTITVPLLTIIPIPFIRVRVSRMHNLLLPPAPP